MANKNNGREIQLVADLEHIIGVTFEPRVLIGTVCTEVRVPRSHVIEKDGPVVGTELRFHKTPHVLVAAKAMREQHRRFPGTAVNDVVAFSYRHAWAAFALS